jgi:hypothetical protein
VFHSPHAGHLPIHFGDSAPQFLQKYVVFPLFAIISVISPDKVTNNFPKKKNLNRADTIIIYFAKQLHFMK